MPFYLVRAQLKHDRSRELHARLRRGEFKALRPFGASLTRGLQNARHNPETGEAVWEEEDYCSPPLAQEREAVLDRYFDNLQVQPVEEGRGWAQIENLPRLWQGDHF